MPEEDVHDTIPCQADCVPFIQLSSDQQLSPELCAANHRNAKSAVFTGYLVINYI